MNVKQRHSRFESITNLKFSIQTKYYYPLPGRDETVIRSHNIFSVATGMGTKHKLYHA